MGDQAAARLRILFLMHIVAGPEGDCALSRDVKIAGSVRARRWGAAHVCPPTTTLLRDIHERRRRFGDEHSLSGSADC